MIPFFEALPETVWMGSFDAPIHTDFRVWMEFESRLLSGEDDIELLELVYPALKAFEPQELVEGAVWFYRGWCESGDGKGEGEPSTGRFYDFAQDADLIFSDFWKVYGIDLTTIKLHWWKFCKLLWGLPGDSAFMRVIDYRTADLSGMDKHRKKHYEKMRKLYAMKNTGKKETLEERDKKMLDYVNRRFAEAVEYMETNR